MALITDKQLRDALSSQLHIPPATLTTAGWNEVIAASNLSAYNEIVGALRGRGFSQAQIDDWDRGVEFNTDIGLFWCLTKGAALNVPVQDPEFINKLDRRLELLDVAILIDGEPVDPDDTGGGGVGYGTLDSSEDRYTRDTTW